ncbi:MAG: hypothetical protein WBD45_10965 [Terriglobales bacterium]
MGFAAKGDEVATPLALVVSVSVDIPFANVPLAPVVGAVNVTETPLTGFESLSTTVAARGTLNADPTVAVCGVPLVDVIVAGAEAMFVRANMAGVDAPMTTAVTVKDPAVEFALKVDERATPPASVASISEGAPLANMPLAPVVGAVNVTETPLVGATPVVTVAISGAYAVPTVVVCGDPFVIVIAIGRFEVTPVSPPQLAKSAIRQNAQTVPQALYLGGLCLPCFGLGRPADPAPTL